MNTKINSSKMLDLNNTDLRSVNGGGIFTTTLGVAGASAAIYAATLQAAYYLGYNAGYNSCE